MNNRGVTFDCDKKASMELENKPKFRQMKFWSTTDVGLQTRYFSVRWRR